MNQSPNNILNRLKNNDWLLCLLLIIILFVVRNLMVIFDMWATYDGADLPETLTAGNFPSDILDGSWRGWNCYLGFTPGHTGWALIPGIVAIPLYALFGNSLLTLCQVPILYSIGIIILMYHLCRKYFGIYVAIISITLYVFLPFRIHQYVIYPYVDLLEAPFYSLLGITLFLRFYELTIKKQINNGIRPIIYMAGFGLVSGIGIFHSEVYVFMLAAILLVWLFQDPKFLIKKAFLLWFLPGLLIGLIPYFIFSPFFSFSFIESWITAKFIVGESTMDPVQVKAETLPNAIFSLFWIFNRISFGLLTGIPLLIIGVILTMNFQRGVRIWKSPSADKMVLNIIRIGTFSYCIVVFFSELAYECYIHPVLAYGCILVAILIGDLLKILSKWKMSLIMVLVVFGMCVYNLFPFWKNLNMSSFGTQLEKKVAIRGNNYFWPDKYFPPSGYKTELTTQVEQAIDLIPYEYDDYNPYPYPVTDYHVQIEEESYPIKRIYTNPELIALFQLDETTIWRYGIDVVHRGLEELVKEIPERGLPKEFEERAYLSLAVHFNSDHWVNYLFVFFKSGKLEETIPENYVKYFYQEFGRRLKSKYGNDSQKISGLIADLNENQRKDIMEGFELAKFKYVAPSFARQKVFEYVGEE